MGTPPQTESRGLGARAANALGWSLLNTAASRFGTLAIGIVLARVLGPQEFGTFAVAMVALLAILAFNDLGVSLAIVRWADEPADIAPTVTSVTVLTSAVLTGLVWVGAPAYASAMGAPAATDPVRWLGMAIFVNGLVATPAALMQREMLQKQRMVIDQVNVWLGALTSLALALTGWGAMSLAVGRLAGSVVSAVMFVVASPLPYRLGWDRDVARRLLGFGLPLAGASVLVFVIGYLDQLVVGGVLGPVQLGLYVLAFNLASWPVSLFSQPLRSVAPALFARVRESPEVTAFGVSLFVRLLLSVSAPACLVLAAAAAPLVALVYGQEWSGSAPVLTWLAVFALVRVLAELCYDLLVVIGSTRRLLLTQLLWVLALAVGAYVAAQSGRVWAVAVAQLVVGLVVVLPLYVWQLHRVDLPLRAVGAEVAPVLALSLAGAAVVAVGATTLPSAAAVGLAGVVGLALLAARRRELIADWHRLRSITP